MPTSPYFSISFCNLLHSLNIKTLTCDKLSHCLFDFDCADLNVYERETYNYQEFFLQDFGLKNSSSNYGSNNSKDSKGDNSKAGSSKGEKNASPS